MACNCQKNKVAKELYQWTSADGKDNKTFNSKDAALLKTARDGGKWKAVSA
jgi:hypothetical protein